MAKLLSADELDRADRFLLDKLRRRFIVARGTLRLILSRYLEIAPDQIAFKYSPLGKPSLAEGVSTKLQFNLSHSDEMAMYAVTFNRKVGIDIERERERSNFEKIAQRFFSPEECEAIFSLPAPQRRAAFFACWTRKEAYLKARGDGLTVSLAKFSVAVLPDEPPRLLYFQDKPDEPSRWQFRALTPGEGYQAALAVEGADWTLKSWQAGQF